MASEHEGTERELFRHDDLLVTTRRFVVGWKTYAMRTVTSVAISTTTDAPSAKILGGGLILAILGITLIVRSHSNEGRTGIGMLMLGLLIIGGWFSRQKRSQVTFNVTLTSASGEQVAYSTTDEGLARELVVHLNDALAAAD
jgi:Family of unknown function (DUF6232)